MTASDEFRSRYVWMGTNGVVDYSCARCGAAVLGYAEHDRWHAEQDELTEAVRAWAHYLSVSRDFPVPDEPSSEGTQQMTAEQVRRALADPD